MLIILLYVSAKFYKAATVIRIVDLNIVVFNANMTEKYKLS